MTQQQTQTPPSNVTEMPQQSLIKTMAGKYGLEANTFKATVIKTLFPSDKQNPSNEQVAAFLVVANQYNLNPFIKEIYAFPGKGGGIIPIVSIDGWNTIINRQPQYDGVEFCDELGKDGELISITAKLYRKDRSHPIMVTEYLDECRRPTEPWKQFPSRMLRHKALIQAARYAFGFSGIYDPDEAERIAAATGAIQEDAPVAVAVISEDQRASLVALAQERGVVEKLGTIVNGAGFDMLAHITVDKFNEVYRAIVEADTSANVIDVQPEPTDFVDQSALEPPSDSDADLDRETEDLRISVQTQLDALTKEQRNNVIKGKTAVTKADKDELLDLQAALEGLA